MLAASTLKSCRILVSIIKVAGEQQQLFRVAVKCEGSGALARFPRAVLATRALPLLGVKREN